MLYPSEVAGLRLSGERFPLRLEQWGTWASGYASAQLLALVERGAHTQVLLLLHPSQPSGASDSSCSSPSGSLPAPCFLPFRGLRSQADDTGTVSNDMDWETGTGPQRKGRSGGIALPGHDSSSLAPSRERGAWGAALASGGAQSCVPDSTCHEEAETAL